MKTASLKGLFVVLVAMGMGIGNASAYNAPAGPRCTAANEGDTMQVANMIYMCRSGAWKPWAICYPDGHCTGVLTD